MGLKAERGWGLAVPPCGVARDGHGLQAAAPAGSEPWAGKKQL